MNEIIDYFHVEETLRLGPGEYLFRFLAECIKSFLTKYNITQDEPLPLGFTFSFPMIQKAVDVGLLVNWTKVNLKGGLKTIILYSVELQLSWSYW